MKKRGGKTGVSIYKKSPKLDEETRKKSNHLMLYICFIEGEKPLQSS